MAGKKSGGKSAGPDLTQGHMKSVDGDASDPSRRWAGKKSVNSADRNTANPMDDMGGRTA